jgi:hypothetical protein
MFAAICSQTIIPMGFGQNDFLGVLHVQQTHFDPICIGKVGPHGFSLSQTKQRQEISTLLHKGSQRLH